MTIITIPADLFRTHAPGILGEDLTHRILSHYNGHGIAVSCEEEGIIYSPTDPPAQTRQTIQQLRTQMQDAPPAATGEASETRESCKPSNPVSIVAVCAAPVK